MIDRHDANDSMIPRLLAYGPNEIEVIHEHVLHDARRDKHIPLRIYVPSSPGPHPLILYSHGAGDSNATSPLLLRHWTSHGYVVIAPTHLFGERPLIERSILRLREELSRPREMGPAAWYARTGDLIAIMDNIGKLPAKVAARIDPNRIAIAGHSFGGYTVMLLGGATLTDPDTGELFRFSDPRPRAVMIISGPGRDHMGLTADSWIDFTKPLMVFMGSRDPGYVMNGGPMWRAEPYEFSQPGDKYLVHMRGAHHLSYVGPVFDLPLRDPAKRGMIANSIRSLARVIAQVAPAVDQIGLFDYARIASVAFWNAYLYGDESARAFLHAHALEQYSALTVRMKAR